MGKLDAKMQSSKFAMWNINLIKQSFHKNGHNYELVTAEKSTFKI